MSHVEMKNDVILVTGAGRGLGAAFATEFARRGASVVVNDFGCEMDGSGSDEAPAGECAKAIRDAGGTALADYNDVSTPDGCERMVQVAIDGFGRLDGVVHNAGIIREAPIADLGLEDFDRVVKTHLYGGFYVTRAAWPHVASVKGRFLYLTSSAGIYGFERLSAYSAAKAGLVGLVRTVANEGRNVGVRANAVAPAASTRMMDATAEAFFPPLAAWMREHTTTHYPAAVAAWLMSRDCAVSGRICEVHGPFISEVITGQTRGFTQIQVTAEDVRQRWAEVEDTRDPVVLADPLSYLTYTDERLTASGIPPRPQPVLVGPEASG